MMKKYICLFFAVVIIIIYTNVEAEGLLPKIEEVYGTPMPSMFKTLNREPDKQTVLDDESVEELWLDVTDDEYDAFGEYLSQSGCEVIDYTVDGNTVVVQIGKDGKYFSLTYNSEGKTASLVYPKGTYDMDLQETEQLYTIGMDAYQIGDYWTAYNIFSQFEDLNYKDVLELRDISSTMRWNMMARRISSGSSHTLGLKADGTVLADGLNSDGECNVSNWTEITAVSAGESHSVGLKANGTVVAVGKNHYGQCNVSDWTNIIAISASCYHTVGLRADGTVSAIGDNEEGQCNVSKWRKIVAISAGVFHTVGLKDNGTVIAVGKNDNGECNVSEWKDIIAVSAGNACTLGLKTDGTVVSTGLNNYGQCNVSKWDNIVAISAGAFHTAGLNKDGLVLTNKLTNDGKKYADNGQHQVSDWKNVVAISAGANNTIGLIADGTVVGAGNFVPNGWRLWNSQEEIGSIFRRQETSEDNTMNSSSTNQDTSQVIAFEHEIADNVEHSDQLYTPLSIGSKGDDVRGLQEALIGQGYLSSKVDGDFGKKTEAAVREAQKAFGMEQTGIADEEFQRRLFSD